MPNILFCHGWDSYNTKKYDDLIDGIKKSFNINNSQYQIIKIGIRANASLNIINYKHMSYVVDDHINKYADERFTDCQNLTDCKNSTDYVIFEFCYTIFDKMDELFDAINFILSKNIQHVIAHSMGCYLILNILDKALNDIANIDNKLSDQKTEYDNAKKTIKKFIYRNGKKIKFTFLMPCFQPNLSTSLLKYVPNFISNYVYLPHLLIKPNCSLINNLTLVDDLFNSESYKLINVRQPIYCVKNIININELFNTIHSKIDIKIIYAENEDLVPMDSQTIDLLCKKNILICSVGKHEPFSKKNDMYIYQGFYKLLKDVLNRKDMCLR